MKRLVSFSWNFLQNQEELATLFTGFLFEKGNNHKTTLCFRKIRHGILTQKPRVEFQPSYKQGPSRKNDIACNNNNIKRLLFMVCSNTMCVSTCQEDYNLLRTCLAIYSTSAEQIFWNLGDFTVLERFKQTILADLLIININCRFNCYRQCIIFAPRVQFEFSLSLV